MSSLAVDTTQGGCAPIAVRAARGSSWLLLLLLCVTTSLRAQYPPLAPTADTTIVVSSGALQYSSISIPVGVTVRFEAPSPGGFPLPGVPAIVLCDGDAIIEGTLSVSGNAANQAAGWVGTGTGTSGLYCGSASMYPPRGGAHAGSYGSVIPFSLDGGSEGGGIIYSSQNCLQWLSSSDGANGGGTLVLLAGGRIEVRGSVTASGGAGNAAGSGGSILLRGDGGTYVFPGASVTAAGGWAGPVPPPYPWDWSNGAPGYVRLDSWGAPPLNLGTVTPAPTVLELPHLRALSAPSIGATWTLEAFAPEASLVFAAASLAPGSTTTQFGLLGLDLATAVGIAIAAAQPSHDPVASLQWTIPNVSQAIGVTLWVQAMAIPPGLPARLTNSFAATLQ
jgi:hypothetical protein